MLYRESREWSRLSPSTHSDPSGTVTSNGTTSGALCPGARSRYGVSSMGVPLTVIWPMALQHTT